MQVTAGYGKVAVVDQLLENLRTGPDRIVYVGDGSSDIHVMLHVNRRDGFTIAVSENKYLAPIAKRSVISDSALAILIPILEEVVGWDPHVDSRICSKPKACSSSSGTRCRPTC